MIRDLDSELVAVRNLAESTTHLLCRFIETALESNDTIDENNTKIKDIVELLRTEQQEYQNHRVKRFDQEVEDACKVLRKNYKVHGYEHYGQEFIPKELFEDVLEENRKLQDRLRDAGHVV